MFSLPPTQGFQKLLRKFITNQPQWKCRLSNKIPTINQSMNHRSMHQTNKLRIDITLGLQSRCGVELHPSERIRKSEFCFSKKYEIPGRTFSLLRAGGDQFRLIFRWDLAFYGCKLGSVRLRQGRASLSATPIPTVMWYYSYQCKFFNFNVLLFFNGIYLYLVFPNSKFINIKLSNNYNLRSGDCNFNLQILIWMYEFNLYI